MGLVCERQSLTASGQPRFHGGKPAVRVVPERADASQTDVVTAGRIRPLGARPRVVRYMAIENIDYSREKR